MSNSNIARIATFFMFFYLFYKSECCKCAKGYYWKDFNGVIPDDAFRAGPDRFGSPLYIGQVLYNNALIPATILTRNGVAVFVCDNQAYSTKENIKVLCSTEPERFKWKTFWGGDVQDLVIGGYENEGPDVVTHIGRGIVDGELIIGKVLKDTSEVTHLLAAKDGEPVSISNYQLLYFE